MSRLCLLLFSWLFVALPAAFSTEEASGNAAVTYYLFDEKGAGLHGVILRDVSGDASADLGQSDSAGVLRAAFTPGTHKLLLIDLQGRIIPLPELTLHAGDEAEFYLTITPDGKLADVQADQPQEPLSPAIAGPVPTQTQGSLVVKLSGVIRSAKGKESIASVQIHVMGQKEKAETGKDGAFALQVPAGTHTFSLIHRNYSPRVIEKVDVSGDTFVTWELFPAMLALQDFVVKAPYIAGSVAATIAEKKQHGGVSEVIGAEQFTKTGDTTAAAALRRVTGISLVGNRYIYVRGMGERYSSTLLNGANLPSPEPERRVVPLDMFPTGVLNQISIEKTYSPEYPGEFGGGLVKLYSRNFPETFFASMSLQTGGNSRTTFGEGLSYEGGKYDVLGFDDGTRSLPKSVAEASKQNPLLERDQFSTRGYTAADLERFGEALPNHWNTSKHTVMPNMGATLSLGNSSTVFGKKAGFLAGLIYSVNNEDQRRTQNFYSLGLKKELELANSYAFRGTTQTVTLGGALNGGVELAEGHNLKSTLTFSRNSGDEARIYDGFNDDVGAPIRVTRLAYIERMLISEQFAGEHELEDFYNHKINWRYTASMASRQEPDRREIRFDQEPNKPDLWILSDRAEGNQRMYSTLKDINNDLGLDYKIPFNPEDKQSAYLQVGANQTFKTREVDTRRFKYESRGPDSRNTDIISQDAEAIFAPEHIGPNGFQFQEFTRQTDNYSADQQISAAYALYDALLFPGWRFHGGARLERSAQHVKTFALFDPNQTPVKANLTTSDVLPSGTITYSFSEELLLRGGSSLTVSRPDFRELSPASYSDVIGGREIYGNPDLKRARIWNGDLRLEWYPTAQESAAVGFFYKKFYNPVETIVILGSSNATTYQNAPGAHNMGVEFEVNKELAEYHALLHGVSVNTNLSLITSEVDLGNQGIQTKNKRALQGQSPYLYNLNLTYSREQTGTTTSLLFNSFGRRISEVGALGAPDIYEEPINQLDFVTNQRLAEHYFASLRLRNLLNQERRFTQGDKIATSYKEGVTVILSATWQY